MTLTARLFALPDIFAFWRTAAPAKQAPGTDFEADRRVREDLREMLFSCQDALQSDYDLMAMMTLYPGKY